MAGISRILLALIVGGALVATASCSSSSGHSAAAFCKEMQHAQVFNLNFDKDSGPQPTKAQLQQVEQEVKKLKGMAPTPQLQAALQSYASALGVAVRTGDVNPVLQLAGDPNVKGWASYDETQCHIGTSSTT